MQEVPFSSFDENFRKSLTNQKLFSYISPDSNKFFKKIYDQTINGIRERFDQPDNQIYVNL